MEFKHAKYAGEFYISAAMTALLEDAHSARIDVMKALNADIFRDGQFIPLSTDDVRRIRRENIKSLIGVRLPDEYEY
jgi:hypothetical protein